MNLLSKEFIRDVKRVIGVEYITSLLTSVFAPIVHDHDDRYFTETESDARFAPIVHNHDDRYFTESESDARFAPIVHTHDDRYFTETESDARFAPIVHTHDDRYYTESETNTLLAAKLDSSSYTAADVLTKVKTVDGAGSGLDADLLDGFSSVDFARVAISNTFVGRQTVQGASDSAQIKLERTGTSAGSSYIGGDVSDAFAVRDTSFNKRFSVSQSGYHSLPVLPAFHVISAPSLAANTTGILIFPTEHLDNNNNYNPATGLFTAPVAGLYKFDAYTLVNTGAGATAEANIRFSKNGTALAPWGNSGAGYVRSYEPIYISAVISLALGDTVGVLLATGGGAYNWGGDYSYFCGHLLG
jgi:hypothetical protein